MIYYEEKNNRARQSAPWIAYYHGLEELFGEDPDIHMDYNEEKFEITMRVDSNDKYAALSGILPVEKIFGDISLKITLVPSNKELTSAAIFDAAFRGNPNYSFTKVISSPFMSNPMTFVVFKKKVSQYFNDNLGDLFGNRNTLPENLARELLVNEDGTFFCTDQE